MRSASRLYTAQLSLGVAGLVAVAVALGVASSAVSLTAPSAAALAQSCGRLLPELSPGGWLILAVLAVGAVAVARGLHSLLIDIQVSRRYVASLRLGRTVSVDGVSLLVIEQASPLAFCAGFLHPRIYLSRGTIEQLEIAERQAVLAHELHHLRRRDPLRILVARSLAAALFFLPVLRCSSERYAALGELAADEAAVRKTGDRGPLAAALLKFNDHAAHPLAAGIAAERVDHLAGEPNAGTWRLPMSSIRVSLGMLGGFLVLVALATQTTSAAGLQLPLLVVQSCTPAMTVGPPALAAGLWLHLRGRRPADGRSA